MRDTQGVSSTCSMSSHELSMASSSRQRGADAPMLRTSLLPPLSSSLRTTTKHSGGDVSSQTCCFCWCCCCSCSCLTVRSGDEGKSPPPSKDSKQLNCNEKEDSLTVEETKSWMESFDRLMTSSRGRKYFREFLRSEYSEENMLFWLACEDLKKDVNADVIEEKARVIYEDYISILSPKEVSLDSRVRETINRSMVRPAANIFDDAQLQVYTLMHRDSYPRFLNSQIYKQLLQR